MAERQKGSWTYIVDAGHYGYEILHFCDDRMKESFIRYIHAELKWKEKRVSGSIFSPAEDMLLDALKEGVVVAVLCLNDDRL